MRVIAGEARGRRLEALPGTDVTAPPSRRDKAANGNMILVDKIDR